MRVLDVEHDFEYSVFKVAVYVSVRFIWSMVGWSVVGGRLVGW